MRDDFKAGVKRTVAARVGNRCSNPSCRALTSGPQLGSEKEMNVGVAAHITAASKGGPRYNPSLSSRERSHPNNAIWLCQNCGKLVDNDESTYSESELRRWKRDAENEAHAQIGKTQASGASTSGQGAFIEEPRQNAFNSWNVPYPPNTFFTGREDILEGLHSALVSKGIVALSGLGGVGKTHIAIEYVYRHRTEYQVVFWVRSDTHEALVSGFMAIAGVLHLPHIDAQGENVAVHVVKDWLIVNSDWLLILDNADDLKIVHEFIPFGAKGRLLLTTQSSATGDIAYNIRVDKLSPEDGALFLLRRAKIIGENEPLDKAPAAELAKAKEISEAVDGLPLALDQAGAFIDETPSSPAEYLELYKIQGTELRRLRGELVTGHPESVAITFLLAYTKVTKASPIAGGLLGVCSFLHPNAIPEELFSEGARYLNKSLAIFTTDQLEFTNAVKEACRFSLLHRDPNTRTLNIHRLVQDVLKDYMNSEARSAWAKFVVNAVNIAFPDPTYQVWERCERLLPHALECVKLIREWDFVVHHTARLINDVGCYLLETGRLTDAEPLLQQSVVQYKKAVGEDHPDFVNALNNLATLHRMRGKYTEAETLYHRALSALDSMEKSPEVVQPLIALSLNNLASLYDDQGKYVEAESMLIRALNIRKATLGPGDRQVAHSLNSLAEIYRKLGKYEEAEPLYRQALLINRKSLGEKHPSVANNLNNLGSFLVEKGNLSEGEDFLRQSLEMNEEVGGLSHIDLAPTLNNLAEISRQQGKHAEAEDLYNRALKIEKETLGADHKSVALTLNNLGLLYKEQGRYKEAEEAYLRSKQIYESTLGTDHPNLAVCYYNLGGLYFDQQDYSMAEKFQTKAIEMAEKALGSNHPSVEKMRIDQGTQLFRIVENRLRELGLSFEPIERNDNLKQPESNPRANRK